MKPSNFSGLPTARSDLGSGHTDVGLNGIYSADFGAGWHVDLNATATHLGGAEPGTSAWQKGWAAAKNADELNKGSYWAGVELYYPLLNLGVVEKTADLMLPHDYQYPDAKPGDAIAPATMFGTTAGLKAEGLSPIEAYAKWMTSPENPTFTRVIASSMSLMPSARGSG